MKNIFVIIGSASKNSANEKLVGYLERLSKKYFNFSVFTDLKTLPHFDPGLSTDNPPKEIIAFRNETAGCSNVIHLNNAGASLMPNVVTESIVDHIHLEASIGGYEASALRAEAIKEFFENSELKNRLVVAYIVGMYIPRNYFTQLTMCKDSLETGCLVGWRTYKEGFEPAFVKKESASGLVTNPLTWKTTGDHADYNLNKGGVITNFNLLRPNISDARIHDGILWINQPHFPGGFLLRMKNFHIADINLFYVNIQQNVRQRIRAYWRK